MKQIFRFTVFIMPVLIVISCKKEATPKNHSINSFPKVNAGKDTTLKLPDNTVILRGIAHDEESNIASYAWTKIQGPAKYTFSTPHSAETIVSNLEKGMYIFELTVWDNMGLWAKDYVTVNVVEISEIILNPSDIIFTNLEWDCFGQCYLAVNNIDSYISPNKPIQVYIKRESSTDWIPVIEASGAQTQYIYYIEDFGGTTLWIINMIEDGSDTPDVKITF